MKNRPKNSLYLALPFMLLARVHTSFSFVIEPSQHARNNLPLAHPHATKLQMGIDDSDMEVLRKRIEKQETQYAKLLMEQSKYEISDDFDDDSDEMRPLPQSVHIILFLPETPEQHVHTIEIPKGSGNNVLLAFEDEGECHMFAEMLVRDLGFVDPCPDETEFEPLSQYCQSARIPVVIVPAGFELTPPQVNSDDEDEDGNIGYNANDINSQLPNQKSVDVFDDLDAWQ